MWDEGTMRVYDFNLKHTFESAQPLAFYADYDAASRTLTFPFGCGIARVSCIGGGRVCDLSASGISRRALRRLFRLYNEMRPIYRSIGTDDFMRKAIRAYYGMRLTLNDPWITTVCFIISQFNNLKRIRRITKSLIATLGDPIDNGEAPQGAARAFPSGEAMMRAGKRALLRCGLGFRWRYMLGAAEFCTHNVDLRAYAGKGYAEVKSMLMEMNGVGEKVADCIALMGFGKTEAFPVDVWVKRTMERVYFCGSKQSAASIREFAALRFGRLAGYAQQYIYWYGRESGVGNGNN